MLRARLTDEHHDFDVDEPVGETNGGVHDSTVVWENARYA